MDLRTELLDAWRALSGSPDAEGWRTINIAHSGPCPLLAGRRFPGNEEALLVGFDSARVPPAEQLPQGKGFVVMRTDLGANKPGRTWIALSRQSQGRLDFFALMAVDLVSILATTRDAGGERPIHAFLDRIRAWQEFMRRGDDGLLGSEAEVGLFGEIEMLLTIIRAGFPTDSAVNAWQGPLGGIQDFRLGTGAIEVKSTLSSSGFPAKVGSLEQLDDSLIQPLFLAAVKLVLAPHGRTLPELIRSARDTQPNGGLTLAAFDSKLIHAGYIDQTAAGYTRRFSVVTIRLLSVTDGFPRLTSTNVPAEISSARYDLDLDLVQGADIMIDNAFEKLGVI
jgi:hypothetical protein